MITVFSLTSDFKLKTEQCKIVKELDFSYICGDNMCIHLTDINKVVKSDDTYRLAIKDFKVKDMPYVIACFNPIIKELRDEVIRELDRLNLLWVESFNTLRTIQEDYQLLNAET